MGTKIRPVLDWRTFTITRKDHPLREKVVAVDANNLLGQAFYHYRAFDAQRRWTPAKDSSGRVIQHLETVVPRILGWLQARIFPVLCFDGKPAALKRRVNLENPIRWYNDITASIEIQRERGRDCVAEALLSDRKLVWEEGLRDLKRVCQLMGVPFVMGVTEGEAQACYLAQAGYAHAAVTQDYDAILYHPPRVVRNLRRGTRQGSQGQRSAKPELYDVDSILALREISTFQLIDAAILLGTDYNDAVPNIGPDRALGLVKRYGCLEEVITACRGRFDFTPITKKYPEIREQFLCPLVNRNVPPLRWRAPDLGEIREFLLEDRRMVRLFERVARNYSVVTSIVTKRATFIQS